MKFVSKKLIVLVSILIVVIVALIFFATKENGFEYESVPSDSQVQFPIDSKLKAAMFVKNFDDFQVKVSNATKQIESSDIKSKWKIFVSQDKLDINNWNTEIYSEGSLPSFSCNLSFTSAGDIISNKGCGWNK